MAPARLPMRLRIGVVAVAVLALLVVAGVAATVRQGASALEVSGGFTESAAAAGAGRATWANVLLTNRSGSPITLRAATARRVAGAEVLDTRVVPLRSRPFLQVTEPLPDDVRSELDASSPVEGFVLPPHSDQQYVVSIRYRPRIVGEQARLDRIAVTYSWFGLDQGVVSDATYCVRAAGAAGCR